MPIFIVLIGLVLLTGVLSPFQSGINAELNRHLGHPLFAAAVNCISAGIYLVIAAFLVQVPFPQVSALFRVPWWAWLGGACGATFVTINLIAAPKLGALLLMVSFIVGTIATSVIIDYFGLVGYPVRGLNTYRLLGVCFLIVSVVLIYKGR